MILLLRMKLPSVANLREHWATRAKRTKAQRQRVALAYLTAPIHERDLVRGSLHGGSQLQVLMTRIAPRKLDTDNLASAFKGPRDQIAEQLGINDGSPQVLWLYAQERGPYGVRIEIQERT